MSVARPEIVGTQDGRPYLLSVLGGLTLIDKATGADLLPRGRKAKALVAYLALNGGVAVTRERLATLLWGDRQNEQARASLRQLLLELRDLSLGSDALLVVERGEIAMRRDLLTLDADRIESCAKAGDMIGLNAALAQWQMPILGDLDGIDSQLDEWLSVMRNRLETSLVDAALTSAETALASGAGSEIATVVASVQRIDPLNERAVRLALRADASSGDATAMHRRFRQFEERLKNELHTRPALKTRQLFLDLSGCADADPVVESTAPERDQEPAADKEQVNVSPHPMAIGASRPSPHSAQNTIPQGLRTRFWKAAPSLLVPAIVLVAVIAVFTQVIALRSAVARLPRTSELVSTAVDPITMELYERGREEIRQRTAAGFTQATATFEEVVERAPSFSRGWSSLAFAQFLAGGRASHRGDDHLALSLKGRAKTSAQRAIGLDAHNGEPYLVFALMVDGRPQSRSFLNQGIAVDPQNADLYRGRGQTFLGEGYARDALADFQRGHSLDPLDPRMIANLASALLATGRTAEARRVLDDGFSRFPTYSLLWRQKITALLSDHRYADAEAMVAPSAVPPAWEGSTAPEWNLIIKALRTGKTADIDAAAKPQAWALGPNPAGTVSPVWRLALLGRIDEAYRLALAHRPYYDFDYEVFVDTAFVRFRRDPRFLIIAGDDGAIDDWQQSGKWPDFCEDLGLPYDCRAVARATLRNATASPAQEKK